MEDEISEKLKTKLIKTGQSSGGCISSGDVYDTDVGKIFVKKNDKAGSDIMFNGEFHGLQALIKNGFRVPNPILLGKNYLVMEYKEIKNLRVFSQCLGKELGTLHLKNGSNRSKIGVHKEEILKFGFDYSTCCGFLPMNNEWTDDWVTFYSSNRIEPHIKKLIADNGDRKLLELWSELQIKIPCFFKDIEVTPSLLHGDLWSGNAGETLDGPITYDPAVYYGHDEFDLAIAKMFGGFSQKFFDAYHEIIPKRPGSKERHNLYLLFHNLNHWSHFGSGYRESSLNLMKSLISFKLKRNDFDDTQVKIANLVNNGNPNMQLIKNCNSISWCSKRFC